MLLRGSLALCLVLSLLYNAFGAYPYDSVAEIAVPQGARFNGGSATLIAVNETQALLLTCQHVVLTKDRTVKVHWLDGRKTEGKVFSLAPNGLDAALVICPRPEGLVPVPVRQLKRGVGQIIVNAGYPGNDHVLRWQKGITTKQTDTTLRYNVRPIPGMSGGPTFDQYGNLVAVVQFYNRGGGGSTGGIALLKYLAAFMTIQEKAAWHGPTDAEERSLAEGDPDGSLDDLPEEFSAWAEMIYLKFDCGPVKEFLKFLEDPDSFSLSPKKYTAKVPTLAAPMPTAPVVVRSPRISIIVQPDQVEITRKPRRIKQPRRRFRLLRRR